MMVVLNLVGASEDKMKIKVSEIFYSIQGEGKYQGVPSIFMRTFGCNFQCRGFGMPKGQLSDEYLAVDPTRYSKYDDLPLVHTGCDSYPSWDVRFKHLSPTLEISDIVDRFQQLLPNGRFGNVHLVITGGEPLLGWQRTYGSLIAEINDRGMDLSYITFETNGTQKLTEEFRDQLNMWPYIEVTFSISSKMPSSGEKWEDAIVPHVVRTYLSVLNNNCYFKWVVSNPEDVEDVQRAIEQYKQSGIVFPVYLMPAGGTEKLYHKNKQWVAKICQANGYRYSQRLHIDLFGNQWGT